MLDLVILVGQAGLVFPQVGCEGAPRRCRTSPQALITEVHRRVALRATLEATIARAA